jgi:hypothetical protein
MPAAEQRKLSHLPVGKRALGVQAVASLTYLALHVWRRTFGCQLQ